MPIFLRDARAVLVVHVPETGWKRCDRCTAAPTRSRCCAARGGDRADRALRRHGEDACDLGLRTEVPRSIDSARRAGVPSSAVEVPPALTARLTDFYRTDYEAFGYPLPDPEAEGQQ